MRVSVPKKTFAFASSFAARYSTSGFVSRSAWRETRSTNFCQPRRFLVSASMAPAITLKKNKLGSSDMMVTEVCLGTMTWGVQNTEEDAHQQLDYAIKECGVNFIDTAEIYPVPSTAPNAVPGATEKYIGTWLAKNPEWRSKIIIATKVMGASPKSKTAAHRSVPPAPEPYPDANLDAANIRAACNASLRRLQVDYIDLYQLHWPSRYVPIFGPIRYNPDKERPSVDFKETLLALKELIDVGKIKAWGVSNETAYGVCELVRGCDEIGMPRPITIQNQFCILNRHFESDLAEACAPSNYNIGLLPWSPLGGGALSGKYGRDKDGKLTGNDKSRFMMYPFFQGRFVHEKSLDVIERYRTLAKEYNMSLATLALKWCTTRFYVPSTIIGATTMEQLKENINAFTVDMSDEMVEKIDEIHEECKNPYVYG